MYTLNGVKKESKTKYDVDQANGGDCQLIRKA